jgi:hypothetical protein
LEVVDEFRVFAVFAAEDLLQFEDGRVERGRAVALEDVGYGLEKTVAEGRVLASPWEN